MTFDYRFYIPCIKWKKGEYQALSKLKSESKKKIIPLIEIPEIGFDFEERKEKKTIDKHLEKLADRIKKKWGKAFCFIDGKWLNLKERMKGGEHPIKYVFDDFRKNELNCIPVLSLSYDKNTREVINKIVQKDNNGLCLRITIEELSKNTLKKQINELLEINKITKNQFDFLIDLASPNFYPISGFCKLIEMLIKKIPYIDNWRTYAIIGTAFPETMAGIKGIEPLHRMEWILYKSLIDRLSSERIRLPTFGDYCITHPKPIELDYRILSPSAKIQYTVDNDWLIIKGSSVKRKNGYYQYHDLCKKLIDSGYFLGSEFSEGDTYIVECSEKKQSSGNLTTWKWVGTNHHIEKIIVDIANHYGI